MRGILRHGRHVDIQITRHEPFGKACASSVTCMSLTIVLPFRVEARRVRKQSVLRLTVDGTWLPVHVWNEFSLGQKKDGVNTNQAQHFFDVKVQKHLGSRVVRVFLYDIHTHNLTRGGDLGLPASFRTLMIFRAIAAGVLGAFLFHSAILPLLPGVAPKRSRRRGLWSTTTIEREEWPSRLAPMELRCCCRCCWWFDRAAHGVPWFTVAAGFQMRAPPGVACANILRQRHAGK